MQQTVKANTKATQFRGHFRMGKHCAKDAIEHPVIVPEPSQTNTGAYLGKPIIFIRKIKLIDIRGKFAIVSVGLCAGDFIRNAASGYPCCLAPIAEGQLCQCSMGTRSASFVYTITKRRIGLQKLGTSLQRSLYYCRSEIIEVA